MNTATHNAEARLSRSVLENRSPPRSRVPHGTVETEFPPVERGHQAVRRECAPLRDITLALSLLLGQHGRVFPSGPSPENPENAIQLSRDSKEDNRRIPICQTVVRLLTAGTSLPGFKSARLSSPFSVKETASWLFPTGTAKSRAKIKICL